MSDIKKLFKRDRFYWGIMPVIIALVVIYMMTNVSGLYPHKFFHLKDFLEHSDSGLLHVEYSHMGHISYEFWNHMTLVTVSVVLIAQTVKLLTQETCNRMEVLRTFPIKSRNLLIYHYLSGLLTIGILLLIQIPLIRLDISYLEKHLYFEKSISIIFYNKEELYIYVMRTLIIFMLHYSLLIVCKKVTNHVPATIFTFAVTELAAWYCLSKYVWMWSVPRSWPRVWTLPYVWTLPMVLTASATVVLILLSYITDQKKDYARDGFYAFPIAHWVVMGIIFGEIYFLSCSEFPLLVAITFSALITAGVYFVARPKKI